VIILASNCQGPQKLNQGGAFLGLDFEPKNQNQAELAIWFMRFGSLHFPVWFGSSENIFG